jgi:hypothetical protein
MNVIAREDHWYLVDVGNGLGRVLDLEFGRFFPPSTLAGLLAKGSWEAFVGDQHAVLAAIDDVRDLAPAATAREHDVLF